LFQLRCTYLTVRRLPILKLHLFYSKVILWKLVIFFKELPYSKHEIEEEVEIILQEIVSNVLSRAASTEQQGAGDMNHEANKKLINIRICKPKRT